MLPKYADTGKSAVPGQDHIWLDDGKHWMNPDSLYDYDMPVRGLLVANWGDYFAVAISDDGPVDYWTGPFYSTRKAAEAAKEAQE